MNENRMKTAVNTGELSSRPAQAAGWGLKIGAEHSRDTENRRFGTENGIDKPSVGRIIAETTGKTQFAP